MKMKGKTDVRNLVDPFWSRHILELSNGTCNILCWRGHGSPFARKFCWLQKYHPCCWLFFPQFQFSYLRKFTVQENNDNLEHTLQGFLNNTAPWRCKICLRYTLWLWTYYTHVQTYQPYFTEYEHNKEETQWSYILKGKRNAYSLWLLFVSKIINCGKNLYLKC